jgi:hypothetical protein
VRAFADWGDPPAGYCEFDLVEHCGGVTRFDHEVIKEVHEA